MFRSAAWRLTLWYVALIMFLSVFFSTALYRVSTQELDRSLHRQTILLRDVPPRTVINLSDLNRLRTEQIEESKDHLKRNLVLFNLMILGGSMVLSFLLAKRTLWPIQESLDAQHQFTADASHELRTPLTAMKTELEVGLRNPKLTLDESKKLHHSTLEEVGKLELLSDHLLLLARQEKPLLHMTPATMQDILQEAVTRAQKLAVARQISIEQKIQSGKVIGDQRSLVELVTTLLDNAVKYSPDGKKITLTGRTYGKHYVFTVVDEGVGIRAVDLPHIFDRFYRADRARSKNQIPGYGLGLSIAKKIVGLHGGTIQVKSTPDRGTTMTVMLPVATPGRA